MFILSIAAGLAFSCSEFVNEKSRRGHLSSVIRNNWKYFKKDFRLIKPRKFGFKTKKEFKFEEYDPKNKLLDPSIYDEFSIELENMKPIEKKILSAYV